MTRRYFLYFSYNGKAYHGWQVQPNGVSVQQKLEEALSIALQVKTAVTGAGRTDSGVHAKLMVAHFNSESDFVLHPGFLKKIDSILPHDIHVSAVREVKPDAHARFDAISRRYEYHIVERKDVFLRDLSVRMINPLDYEKMNLAAARLFDYIDFTSFSKLHTDNKTNDCTITKAEWTLRDDVWVFTIEANRFLRNMVRAVVGTLIEVGKGKMSLEEFCQVIEAKDRCKAGSSVPARGLYLVDVKYPEAIFKVSE